VESTRSTSGTSKRANLWTSVLRRQRVCRWTVD
jgi:hypothetical protein